MDKYKSLDEVIELYKEAKSRYNFQLNNLKQQKIPDYKSWLNNTYNDLVKYGKILEDNGIDIGQFNEK